jgi:hypothetical protein
MHVSRIICLTSTLMSRLFQTGMRPPYVLGQGRLSKGGCLQGVSWLVEAQVHSAESAGWMDFASKLQFWRQPARLGTEGKLREYLVERDFVQEDLLVSCPDVNKP